MTGLARTIAGVMLLLLAGTMPGTAADRFGAIAYSPANGAWGYWYNAPNQAIANARALANCRKHGRGCRIATRFHNACGAVYAGATGWGADWGNDRRQAERKAAARCARRSRGCRRVAWSCTSR